MPHREHGTPIARYVTPIACHMSSPRTVERPRADDSEQAPRREKDIGGPVVRLVDLDCFGDVVHRRRQDDGHRPVAVVADRGDLGRRQVVVRVEPAAPELEALVRSHRREGSSRVDELDRRRAWRHGYDLRSLSNDVGRDRAHTHRTPSRTRTSTYFLRSRSEGGDSEGANPRCVSDPSCP